MVSKQFQLGFRHDEFRGTTLQADIKHGKYENRRSVRVRQPEKMDGKLPDEGALIVFTARFANHCTKHTRFRLVGAAPRIADSMYIVS